MELLFACLMIFNITGLSKEKAQMIINIANKAFIYTSFCFKACANTAFQYLPIKKTYPTERNVGFEC